MNNTLLLEEIKKLEATFDVKIFYLNQDETKRFHDIKEGYGKLFKDREDFVPSVTFKSTKEGQEVEINYKK